MPTGHYKRKSKSGIKGNITGYKNYYVTRCGRVFSLFQNKFLMATVNTNGYSLVCLSKNNRKKIMRVHRLVARVYIGKPRRNLEGIGE